MFPVGTGGLTRGVDQYSGLSAAACDKKAADAGIVS